MLKKGNDVTQITKGVNNTVTDKKKKKKEAGF